MISFPRVDEVAVNSRIESRQARQISDAITARVLSGLGDAAKRMVFWWLSSVRQIRNPDASGYLFAPQAEYLQIYQHLGPDVEWPVSGPGDPEGINLATIMGSFVYGNDAGGIDSEDTRLSDPYSGGVQVDPAQTPGELWELGKIQRGAYDPETGALGAPAFLAARKHFEIIQSPTSPHGNSYGGFFPTPEYLGECSDGTSDSPATPNYAVRFSSTKGLAARSYPGTCPDDPASVARVINYPLGYYVILNSGQVDYLPKTDWIEGPYSGGNRLSKAPAEALPRVLNKFVGEFRGTPDQRQAELDGRSPWLSNAFNIRRFLTSQYLLSPACGVEILPGQISADYQTKRITGVTSVEAGRHIGSPVRVTPGFVIAAGYARATGLVSDVVVELRDNGTLIASMTLSPDENGNAEAIVVLDTPSKSGRLQWTMGTSVRWGSGGDLMVETAELWEYLPGLHDLMLVCRLGGAHVAGVDGTDGSGIAEEDAVGIWDAYRTGACIPQRRENQYLEGSLDTIGRNAVVDAFRRWSRMVRVVPRQQLLGYAVEDGKSVLWFSPYAAGLSRDARADSFGGIRDEIARVAPAGGYTNRWCMFTEAKRYHPSGSSIWKTDVYADYWLFSDRCGVWTRTYPPIDPQLQRHFNLNAQGYSAKVSYAPEIMSGYRYALNLNHSGTSEAFYRSCRVYEPPLEVESCTTVIESGEEVVKVVLTGRLHHHHSLAPSSISRDITTWDRTDLTAEAADYRTEENAIRESLLNAADNTYQCEKSGPGNSAADSTILSEPGVPFGACMPHCMFVQLPPAPHSDGNSVQDASDTPLTHELMSQYELWIRVMSEGYVDGETTVEYGCQSGIEAVFDYKFESLCYKAFGTGSFLTLGSHVTDALDESEIRPDKPLGYGPLPHVRTTAEVHNLFAKALNRLTRVRVMLPWKFEARTLRDLATKTVTSVTHADGTSSACGGGGGGWVFAGDPGDVAASTEVATWADVSGAYSIVEGGFALAGSAYACDGSNYVVYVQREEQEYRWSLVDPDAQYAMPETWRNQLAENGEMLGTVDTQIEQVTVAGYGAPTTCNGIQYWNDGTGYVEYASGTVTTSECRIQPAFGKIHAPRLGSVTFIGAAGTPICNELDASVSSNVRSLTPIPTDALILNVPLVDPGADT